MNGYFRGQFGQFVTDSAWTLVAGGTRLLPFARPERYGVERIVDVAYADSGQRAHLLDVYRPIDRQGPCPVVFYVHGGSFRILSKDSHWVMALAFARRGYVVFTINYRLAPAHRFPAALEDSCAALLWVLENAHRFDGDSKRLVIAGESAGANLVTSLAIAASYRRPEPWAARVWDAAPSIRAALPACGILQVSDAARFTRRKRKLSPFIHDRLLEIEQAYLGDALNRDATPGALDLADPVVLLERGEPPARPLPPFFLSVGTRDPLLDDTRRLKAALDRLGVPSEARYYPGEVHAFHALVWRAAAKAHWRDTHAFLDQRISP